MKLSSPLQRVHLKGRPAPVYLKREDLLPRGGGNKIRRFEALFRARRCAREAVALSDGGSHTFAALLAYLDDPAPGRLERLRLFERRVPATPYGDAIRARYRERSGVSVVEGPAPVLLLRYLAARAASPDDSVDVGLGGGVKLGCNPYREAAAEVLEDLGEEGGDRPFLHCLAMASSRTAEGVVRGLAEAGGTRHGLLGVLTGPAPSALVNRVRWARRRTVRLARRRPLSYGEYCERARAFHDLCGVWLDPVHTIHVGRLLLDGCLPLDAALVLWITCPHIPELVT